MTDEHHSSVIFYTLFVATCAVCEVSPLGGFMRGNARWLDNPPLSFYDLYITVLLHS